MKLLVNLLFVSFLPMALLHGQGSDYIRNHDEGPLSWSDFQGGISPTYTEKTHAEFYLGYRPELQKTGDSAIYRLKAVGYMDKGLSYSFTVHRTDNRLRYHQLQFDLLELYRRRLQKELDLATRKTDLDALFRNNHAEYVSLNAVLELDFQRLEEAFVFKKWGNKLDSLLLQTPSYEKPAATFRPFSFGVYYGLGATFINEGNVSSPLGLRAGLEVGYNQLSLLVGLRSVPLLPLENTGGYLSSATGTASYFDFLLRYPVFERSHIALSPLAGMSVRANENNGLIPENKHLITAGLNVDISLKKHLYHYAAAFGERKMYAITAIRTQFLISNYRIGPGQDSFLFSLGLNLYLGAGGIR